MFYVNACIFMNALNVIYDVYLIQNQYTLTSHEWDKERISLNECVRQLEQELGAFYMDLDDEAHGPGGGDA